MSRIILPYRLQDGQRAYAARLMADLEALAGKFNDLHIEGLGEYELEAALAALHREAMDADDGRGLAAIRYDGDQRRLYLTLQSGAVLSLDMSPFLQPPLGSTGEQVQISVDSAGRISAALQDGCIDRDQLTPSLAAQLDGCVTAGIAGNADDILFADGESFAEKLEAGELKGADGVSVTLGSIYYLRYDETDGHLYLGVADDAERPPLSIDSDGHLIYTIT